LLGHVALEIVARLFYAQQDTLTPLGVAAAAMVVNVVLAGVLVVSLAQAGLALANSIAVSAEVLLGLWLLGRRLDGIGGRQLTVTLFRTGLAGLAMAIAMSVTAALLPGLTAASPFWSGLVTVAVGGSVGLAVYLVAATALGVTELRDLARLLLRRSSAG
jgi:putative peptidoglycan lipid II flippase